MTDDKTKEATETKEQMFKRLDAALQQSLDVKTRQLALDYAIKSGVGVTYDEEARHINDPALIVKAAKMFETYLEKGTTNE